MKHLELWSAESDKRTAAPDRRPDDGVIVVIDRRALARECLTRWLANEFPGRHIVSCGCLSATDAATDQAAHVVILAPGTRSVFEVPVMEQLELCRRRWPGAPVVVLSERDAADEVMRALQLGVSGYIPAGLSANVAVEALRLVAAGGSFIPPSALRPPLPRVAVRAAPEAHRPSFTPRQREVLDRLRRGESNKAIAHELSMSENTVKVHIRHIMRKLGVSNRTQIALHSQAFAGLPGG